MWLEYEPAGKFRLHNPVMVVALSTALPQYKGLYSQGKELADYMTKKMKFVKMGTVRTSALPPEVLVRGEGVASLPECTLYLSRGKRDVVLLAGDSSPMDEQYEFAEFLLEKAEEMGVKELYSVGARWTENPIPPEAPPQASGFSTDGTGVAKLKKADVKVLQDEPAPFFASMVVAMAREHGIRGYKLAVDHGEPSPHVRSVLKLLEILEGAAGFKLDLGELRGKVPPPSPARSPGSNSIYH